MRLTILETGIAPAGLADIHGTYGDMFERMLAPFFPDLAARKIRVYEGEPLPQDLTADGYLLTGSPAGVYEPHEWIPPLEEFVRKVAEAGLPQVGICFGHQLMAQAFGGRVEKAAQGWGVGVHTYDVSEAAPVSRARISCALSHQDQVTAIPEGAAVLGGSGFCPNGVLAYAQGPALSFQMHPEFEHDFAKALLRLRADRIPAAVSEPALSSLDHDTDRELMAEWIADFYIEHKR